MSTKSSRKRCSAVIFLLVKAILGFVWSALAVSSSCLITYLIKERLANRDNGANHVVHDNLLIVGAFLLLIVTHLGAIAVFLDSLFLNLFNATLLVIAANCYTFLLYLLWNNNQLFGANYVINQWTLLVLIGFGVVYLATIFQIIFLYLVGKREKLRHHNVMQAGDERWH